ncbi:hypothetical protein M3226_30575 [Neobacillus cucumis]|uniref:hypothetical protein n=1 Tax=Neobacillus cucumis TaxID=1740721 RepID=UPI00203E5285|nr:hypothetical protein [Neobacillus cucumis]MCM3729871.1 hypothetical protein [Neobacillus cucumis]
MKKLVAGLLSVGLLFTGFSSAQAEGKALGHYKDKAQGKAIGHIQKVEQEVSVVPEPTVKEVPVIETLTGGITDSVRGGCGAEYYVCGSNPQLLEAIIFKRFVNGSFFLSF